jgi:hypothetical protein
VRAGAALGEETWWSDPTTPSSPKDPDYLMTRIYLNGYAARVNALTSCDTLWDASRAPSGRHLVGVEEFAAPFVWS